MNLPEPIRTPAVRGRETPWKSCDLRGVYPDPISPDLFRTVGSAIGTMLSPNARVVVAGDFRLSTRELKRALIEGLMATDVRVLDAGQIPTPVAYFAGTHLRSDAVLMVTASHNPAEHNGLKLMLGGVPTTPAQLADIRALATGGDFRGGLGTYESVDLLGMYERSALERWRHLDPTRFSHIILDAGNGAWSEIAPRIFKQLGFAVQCISCVVDGSFPDRPSDCSRTENLTALRSAVAKHPNSLGIAWDGDGDRVAFIDETGLHVSADEISLLLAYAVLKNHGAQARIVVDIKLSAVVRREILAHGGVPLLERTGHAFVRGRMVADDALLGLDACGHYFYRELSGGDDGLFAALFVLDLLQHSGRSLSALRNALPAIFTTPELRIPADLITLEDALQRLTAALPVVEMLRIDGVQLILNDGIVLIRHSGTEPVLSLRIEGFDRSTFDVLVEQCLRLLPAAELHLRNQLAGSAH